MLEDLLRLYTKVNLEILSNDEIIETLLVVAKTRLLLRRRRILFVVDPLLKKIANTDLLAEAIY